MPLVPPRSNVIDLRQPLAVIDELTKKIEALEALGPKTAASAYRLAAQTIPINTFTAVKCDTIAFDLGGNFNAEGAYVIPSTGKYLVTGQVAYQVVNATSIALVTILQNGGEALRGTRNSRFTEAGIVTHMVAGIIHAIAGEVIVLAAFVANETGLEIASDQNRLSIVRVA